MPPTKLPSSIRTPPGDDCYSLHVGEMWLRIYLAAVSQTGEDHSYKNIWRYITTSP